ncbi:MAG: LCP family protein [Solirubrobacterales bacterium]
MADDDRQPPPPADGSGGREGVPPPESAPDVGEGELPPPKPRTWAGQQGSAGEQPAQTPDMADAPETPDPADAEAEPEGPHDIAAEQLTQVMGPGQAGIVRPEGSLGLRGGAAPAPEPSAPVAAERDPELTPAEGGLAPGMVLPPGYDDVELPETEPTRRMWPRFLVGSAIVVVAVAAATATSVLLYLSDIAEGLGRAPELTGIEQELQNVDAGEPQTIMLIGSDRRFGDKEQGLSSRSDTVILMRLDPDRGAIATLRLPRDLKVKIPGVSGRRKLNEAYAEGGPSKTLATVRQTTGLRIHHLVNVNFNGFQRAVNAINCVYIDVDRRYFNSNEGVPADQQYDEIDLKPGYQRLCGSDALDYVRYRHEDNDLVRGARQQEFLRQARQQVGPSRLLRDRSQLISIFTSYTSSDIDDSITMLEVLKLFLASRDAPVREVNLKVKIGPTFVTASRSNMQKAVDQFLGIEGSSGPRGDSAEPRRREEDGKKKTTRKKSKGASGLSNSNDSGAAQAATISDEVDFPVFYPSRLEKGSRLSEQTRAYRLGRTGSTSVMAYKMVARRFDGQYYGISSVDWTDPPILKDPDRTVRQGGRTLMVYDGTKDRPRIVAFQRGGSSYWVTNTLLQSLSESEMLTIAASTKEFRP